MLVLFRSFGAILTALFTAFSFPGYSQALPFETIADCAAAAGQPMMSFAEARSIAQRLGLTTRRAFQNAVKSGSLPEGFPIQPWVYEGWRGYGDFGHGIPETAKSFKEHLEIVDRLDILSERQWVELRKQRVIPSGYAVDPVRTYRELTRGWEAFTGNRFVPKALKPAFKTLRAWAREQKFADMSAYRRAVRNGTCPDNAPLSPDKNYAHEYRGEDDFLRGE